MKFVSIGNVIFESRGKRLIPRGSALIAAITASKLGLRTTLITRASAYGERKLKEFLKGTKVKLINIKSPRDTVMRFEERIICLSYAGGIRKIDILGRNLYYIAPALKEEIDAARIEEIRRAGGLIVLNAKGFVRGLMPDGSVAEFPWLRKGRYLKNVDILKINPQQLLYTTGKATLSSTAELLRFCPYILLTLGEKGAYIFYERKHLKVPVYEVKKVEAITGAGDVFAAAFSIRFHETNDIRKAAYFASAAASFYVEGGVKGIATRKKIEKRAKILSGIFL